MSLASYGSAKSVTGLSESPVYHYQYSSICDTIHNLAKDSRDYEGLILEILANLLPYYRRDSPSLLFGLKANLLQIDVCNAEKGATRCFESRTQNYKSNNQVVGNKPVSPGYAISFVNLYDPVTGWTLPLRSDRVLLEETDSECAHRQLKSLLSNPDLGFGESLCISVLDSKYGNAAYLSSVYAHKNLVNIVRHCHGSKIFASAPVPENQPPNAAKQYGEEYFLIPKDRIYKGSNASGEYAKLQSSLFNLPHSDFYTEETTMDNGREARVEVYRWNYLKIRTKDGNSMKDKPLDMCCIRIFDALTGEPIFKKELWFSISGQRKDEVPSKTAYLCYRQRYGIEPYFRFNKQNLFFHDYQTPDSQHFDNWRLISQLALWLLFIAEEDIDNSPKKWQKYLPANKNHTPENRTNLSLAQAYHGAQTLFCRFDQKPFLPKPTNKPHGRKTGEIQTKRPRFPIVKKPKKTKKTKNKTPKAPKKPKPAD
jgi:hypothetical protein